MDIDYTILLLTMQWTNYISSGFFRNSSLIICLYAVLDLIIPEQIPQFQEFDPHLLPLSCAL